jgi:hypothetical protein
LRALPRFALVAALVGCALRPSPLPIEPHLAGGLAPDVPEARLRLGVAAFEDARPAGERAGQIPPLRLRWFGLAREGENQSGDGWFAGDVAEGARADAAVTLARSGAWRSVRAVDAIEADLVAGRLPDGSDRVLSGRVESLLAIQHQDSVASIAVVGFLRSRFGAPRGYARVRYRLFGPHGLEWESEVEARHTSAGRTLVQAALDALARANEQAADALFREVVPASERARRIVPVRLLDACNAGETRARQLVAGASAVFEREIGVTLVPRYEGWRIPELGLEPALRLLAAQEPAPGGIALGLLPIADDFASAPRFGLSVQLGAHALVACAPGRSIRVATAAHEIAHLFGAIHVQERGSLMFPVLEFDGRYFDPWNARVLRATADRPFGSPLPPAMARELEAIYRVAGASPAFDGEDVEAARRAITP